MPVLEAESRASFFLEFPSLFLGFLRIGARARELPDLGLLFSQQLRVL